jgi:hypothetical protein
VTFRSFARGAAASVTPRRYGLRIVCKLVATGCVIVGCGSLAGAATWSNLNATTTSAANTFSAASSWGPSAPTAVTTTPRDGTVALSWTAPSSTGGSAITGYTATAAPSGQTCTTTGATSCTITGLTDGSTQSITVTATNSYGTGSASTAVSATAYPSGLFTSGNGLSLWLDGADASTLFSGSNCTGSVSGGGSVGCWKDKSSVGENFTQTTSASQPALGSLNGLGAINFTSVGQVLTSINSSDSYQTVFLVVQPQATASQWETFFGQAASDFSIRAVTSGATQFSSPNGNDWAYNTGTPPLDWTNGLQAAAPSLGATSIITDQAVGPQSFSTSVSTSFAANGYTRGMLGDVGEVIAFSGTLTTAQRRTVEDYLARKWGTTITPDPPGTPIVTAGASSASVSWAAPAYDGGSSVTGYTVTASPGTQSCTTSGATSCTVTGLTNGTSYTFAVTAANTVGAGSSSPSSAAVTPTGLPGAPTTLTDTATTTALAVSWSAPSNNGGAAITSYTASVTPGGASCTSATTSCTIRALNASTTYAVTVTASNSVGTGPASSPLNATTATPPGAPTGVAATAGDGQVAVSWTAPSASGSSSISGYTATASPSGQTCATTTATSCTITGLSDGATQTITVTASNSYGTGQASNAVNATPYPAALFTSGNGLSLWLDGADASTFSGSGCSGAVSSGGSVGCWKDKSGKGENFTQATSGSRPVLSTLNGLGAINFTSASQVLNSINSTDTYQTVFLVAQPQTTPSGYDYMFGQAGSDFNIRETTNGNSFSAGNTQDWATGTGSPPLDWTNGRQATDLTFGQTTVITDQSSSPHSFATSVSSSFAAQGYTRGMLGDVGEVIAFSGTLTTAQRRTVEDYLARKWATTITPDPPGAPTVSAGTATSASVAWAAPAYDGGSAVTGYTVTASPGGQTCTTSGAISCTVTGLTNGTSYTFAVTATNSVGTGSSSPSSPGADWVAPTASASAIGRSGAYFTGFIKQGASYYVYANVTDSGIPTSGIASVTADVHTITSGSTAVALTAGTYSAGGTAYNYRSAALTAATSLAAGSDAYTVTSTDNAGNSGTQNYTTTIDNTAPTAVDVQSTNVSGGTVGHVEQGDTLKLTYSGAIDPYSILAGWTGATTNVQIALVDGGGTASDLIYVYTTASSPTQIPVGIITLNTSGNVTTGGGNYIVYGATGTGTPSTMTLNGSVITLVFGLGNAQSATSTTAAAMSWAPSTTATDIAGNANTATAATQSGTVHVNF